MSRLNSFSDRAKGLFEPVFKVIASTAFVLFAVGRGALESPYGRWILLALALSWVGDLLLILRGKGFFLAGLASFLAAHLAFSAAFLVRGVNGDWIAAGGAGLLVAAALAGWWVLPHVRRKAPQMMAPVVVYIVAIAVMVSLAAGASADAADRRILFGAVVFFLSDLSVARDRFIAPGWINRAWGLPLYYGAQFLLAATVGS